MRLDRLLAAGALVSLILLAGTPIRVDLPAYGSSLARLLPPARVLEEVRTDGGGIVRAPRVEIEPDAIALGSDDSSRSVPVTADGGVRSRRMWLGTDHLGRDVAWRVVAGGVASLRSMAIACLLVALLGGGGGLLVAVLPRWARRGADVVIDTWLALPKLLVLMVLALAGGAVDIGLAIAAVAGPGVLRLCEREALAAREGGFVTAVVATGCTPIRLASRHLAPQIVPVLLASLPMVAVESILLETSMTFLGFQAVARPHSWGAMIAEGLRHLPTAWWMVVAPAVALIATALALRQLAGGPLARRDRIPG